MLLLSFYKDTDKKCDVKCGNLLNTSYNEFAQCILSFVTQLPCLFYFPLKMAGKDSLLLLILTIYLYQCMVISECPDQLETKTKSFISLILDNDFSVSNNSNKVQWQQGLKYLYCWYLKTQSKMFHYLCSCFILQCIVSQYINHKVTDLKSTQMNDFQFIHEICCSYQKKSTQSVWDYL